MAPYSPAIVEHLQPQLTMEEARNLINSRGVTNASLTPSQQNILLILALIFSTISVTSSVLAFYWFVKMRRSFRHDLIMLLIQSDMFKALWFMMYPIVVFSQGQVRNASPFCQVSGFFVAVGLEASDFAILQIAVHTALYIFNPRLMGGEGGLYPYRYFAYAGWLVFPLLMAALAFVNPQDSYVIETWIPRYMIFIVILLIYASIYYYVRYKFHGFTKTGKSSYAQNVDSMDSADGPRRRHTFPTTPTLACHGLIPESRQTSSSRSDTPRKAASIPERQPSSRGDGKSNFRRDSATHRFMWSSFAENTTLDLLAPPSTPPSTPDALRTGPPSPATRPVREDTAAAVHTHVVTMSLSPADSMSMEPAVPAPVHSRTSWRDGVARRFSHAVSGKPSIADIPTALRRGADNVSDISTPLSQLELVNSFYQNIADAEMHRTRDKIRRQLRFLFIYPLVYMGMWVVPFVSHVLQYDDRFAINPPFSLTCLTTIFVCSQAAVDCWLFSTREKPWRHMPGHDGTFWGSFGLGSDCDGPPRRKAGHGLGKTREEMNLEARAAYQRRDEERAQATQQRRAVKEAQLPDREARTLFRSGGTDWWDVPSYDGRRDTEASIAGMCPLAEEDENAIDDTPTFEKEGVAEELEGEQEESTYPRTEEQLLVFSPVSFQDSATSGMPHKK